MLLNYQYHNCVYNIDFVYFIIYNLVNMHFIYFFIQGELDILNRTLKRYVPIAHLIGKTFGSNCEVVLHDLTKPQNSIVYTVNSHVTGKEIGETFNILIKKVLLSKSFKDDITANYKTVTADGREIKSSTAFIRNANNDVVGAMCINYDLEKMKDMKIFLDEFMTIDEDIVENESDQIDSVLEIADDIIDKTISKVDFDLLSKDEKIDLIYFMEQKGIFLIKGSIDKVANKLGISRVTVYSYLDEIKKGRK